MVIGIFLYTISKFADIFLMTVLYVNFDPDPNKMSQYIASGEIFSSNNGLTTKKQASSSLGPNIQVTRL